jgi:nitroimidazol reductase NimA-like FMN-containing flavoprotein (pyridoxamine 5'-phosphate oxidase superfamily)
MDVREVMDANRYMVIATADARGVPWVSPVWFATDDYRELVWVSRPGTRHSQNIGARQDVAIVVFDSQVPPGSAQAVYLLARAEEIPAGDTERGLEVFNRGSEEQGLRRWTLDEVRPPGEFRLYRATAIEHFLLGPHDERLPIQVG